jgi:8-oxo-dGTP pyrophosphatase MutT (NUDIX family)
MGSVEIYEEAPESFLSKVRVVACYLEANNRVLLLQKAGSTEKWGFPGGKIEGDEGLEDGLRRELFEETGISIRSISQIRYLDVLYVRKPDIDYELHLFQIKLDHMPDVQLSFEHKNYQWVPLENLDKISFITAERQALEYCKTWIKKQCL